MKHVLIMVEIDLNAQQGKTFVLEFDREKV
jgi:hypothetical protein